MRWAAVALFLVGPLTISLAQAEESVSVRSRFEKTFALHGDARGLKPGPTRESSAGSAQPAPGEITVGISTTAAVGYPKLHVYERSTRAIAFKATAMNGTARLGTQDLCGHLQTDSWILLPAKTTKVLLSHFVEVQGDCP